MRKKRWTEKQIKEKIQDLKSQISYKRRNIKRTEDEIRDHEVLLEYYKEKLAKKHDNPSSVQFGAKE